MAASDFFLKIDGIPGESLDDKHKNEIDILSWSFSETNSGSMSEGGGGGRGRVSIQDFHFTMRISKASPLLFLKCAEGEHIKEATFVARKSGTERQEYLKIKFSELMVSSYQTSGQAGGPDVVESITLNFAKIEIDYKPQKGDGTLDASVKHGWDLKGNKKV